LKDVITKNKIYDNQVTIKKQLWKNIIYYFCLLYYKHEYTKDLYFFKWDKIFTFFFFENGREQRREMKGKIINLCLIFFFHKQKEKNTSKKRWKKNNEFVSNFVFFFIKKKKKTHKWVWEITTTYKKFKNNWRKNKKIS